MVRVRFANINDAEATLNGSEWGRCANPPLLACLRAQAAEAIVQGDVELGLARLACRAWGGRVVSMSWPRPRDDDEAAGIA